MGQVSDFIADTENDDYWDLPVLPPIPPDVRKTKYRRLWQKYGLTAQQYDKLYTEQKGCCAICGKHQVKLTASLFVDHDHRTDRVRGLLCILCNSVLGYAKDNTVILRAAIAYLEENGLKK